MFERSAAVSLTIKTIKVLQDSIDKKLKNKSPSGLILVTAVSLLALQIARSVYRQWDTKRVKQQLYDGAMKAALHLPIFGRRLQHRFNEAITTSLIELQNLAHLIPSNLTVVEKLPDDPKSDEFIRERLSLLNAHLKSGKTSGISYAKDDDEEIMNKIAESWEEAAFSDVRSEHWPLLKTKQAEIISWYQYLLHDNQQGFGIITHDNDNSIIEACSAYVRYARARGKTHPEIIVPQTANLAFARAASVLNVKLVTIPVDSVTGQANVALMQQAIGENTCLMVGSAPSTLGVIDPISELAYLARERHIPFHVDLGIDGFLTLFANRAGFKIPSCDFNCPGVTSISIGTEYAQAPKGTGILVFAPNCGITSTYTHVDKVGGMSITPTMESSRSGGDIVALWTTMMLRGANHYVEMTKRILTLQQQLVSALSKCTDIIVPYHPLLATVGVQMQNNINASVIVALMGAKGWSLDLIFNSKQSLPEFQLRLTDVHAKNTNFVTKFVADLKACISYAKSHPNAEVSGRTKTYEVMSKAPIFVRNKFGEALMRFDTALPGKCGFWRMPRTEIASEQIVKTDAPALK